MKRFTVYVVGVMIVGMLSSPTVFSQKADTPEAGMINDEQLLEKMKIFPNPSDGRFQLSLEFVRQEKLTAMVFDITGKLVRDISEELVIGESSISADVDLQSPSTGIYFLRIEVGRSTFTKKIIIR